MLDKCLPIEEVRALLGVYAPYVDIWKFGWGTAYLDPAVVDKVTLLRDWDVLACTGGTLLELSWVQGRHTECLAWAADCGFPCVEVSNGVVAMSQGEKLTLVQAAAGRFTVLTEVGSKDPNAVVSPEQWAEQATRDLSAGATWVVGEGREAGTVGLYEHDGKVRTEVVSALTAAVGVERLIFEAPRRGQQACLIREFGANVSLGNISPGEVLGVETLRLGLRADTLVNRQASAESVR